MIKILAYTVIIIGFVYLSDVLQEGSKPLWPPKQDKSLIDDMTAKVVNQTCSELVFP